MPESPWTNFAVAVAIGLLIGVERERRKGEGVSRQPLGIRTFALAALLGALASQLGGVVMIATAAATMAMLAAVSYFHSRCEDPGLTTEVGVVATTLLGALAMSDMSLAAALGVVVAGIFWLKEPIHVFVKGVLTETELRDSLLFAIAALVIWPQLPDRYMGPFDALNPSALGLLIVLVLAIGAGGYVATRALGVRYGLPLMGFASGFVSSSATIASLGGEAARSPQTLRAAVAGATLSSVATFIEMAVLLFVVSQATFNAMAPALAAGGIVAALYGLAFTFHALNAGGATAIEPPRALNWRSALTLAAIMATMLVAAAGLKERVGGDGGRARRHFRGLRRHARRGDFHRLARRHGEDRRQGSDVSHPSGDELQRCIEERAGPRRGIAPLRPLRPSRSGAIDGRGVVDGAILEPLKHGAKRKPAVARRSRVSRRRRRPSTFTPVHGFFSLARWRRRGSEKFSICRLLRGERRRGPAPPR